MNHPIAGVAVTREQEEAFRRASAGLPPAALAPLSGFTTDAIWNGYTPPGFMVKGMIGGASELTVLFGVSGHFKTAVAIDLAMCVASEIDYHGVRTRHGAVLYVAGEGHLGIRKRLRAWMMAKGMDATSKQPKIFVTTAGADLMNNSAQLTATVKAAGEQLDQAVQLVVFDTLAANFGQGDENHASDMAYAIGNARQAAPDAAITMVHHIGHGDGQRERGSSALAASCDYRLLAVYDDTSKLIEVRFAKVKDDERPEPLVFEWRKLNLDWTDEDGEELTSIVLDRIQNQGVAATKVTGLGEHADRILTALRNIHRRQRKNLEEKGRDPNDSRVLIDGLRGSIKNMDRRRFHQAFNSLVKRRLVLVDDQFVICAQDEL